ncbi:MAG: hypothetical protein CMJ59_02920, partial [Planctomycetaceae bacterium]|nr:hypothetical protein [Planctomycetaceae bacterium]
MTVYEAAMTKQALKNSYRKLVRRAGRLQFPLLAVLALAIMVTGYVCVANDPFDGSYFRTRSFKATESGPQQTDDGDVYTRNRFKRVETVPRERGPETTGEAHPFQSPDRRTEASEPQPEVPFSALVPAEPVAIPAPRALTEDSLDLASPAETAQRGLSEHNPPEEIAPTHLPALPRAERFSGELFSSESIAVPRAAAPSDPAGTRPALPRAEGFSGELFSSESIAVPHAAAPSAPAGTLPGTPTALPPVEEFSGERFSSEVIAVPHAAAPSAPAGTLPGTPTALPPVEEF